MAIATPGDMFTFQVLFLDPMSVPIIPPDANIEVFAFDPSGSKVTLVAAGAPMSSVLGDPGRYIYVYPVPAAWSYQPTLYGVMRGTDPATSMVVVVEMDVDIIHSAASLTVLNNGVVVSSDVASMNITGSGVTVTSAAPGSVEVSVQQPVGRGLIAQFVRGG